MNKSALRRFLPLLVCALALVVAPNVGFAEEGAEAGHEAQSVFDTIREGGPLIMAIWVAIIGTSVTMVTLIIQNAMQLRKDKLAPLPLIHSLRQLIAAGNYQEAWETCNANNNYLSNVLRAGLSRIGRGMDAV